MRPNGAHGGQVIYFLSPICGCPWSVCEVGLVPCVVGTMIAVVAMVMLFVWDVSMLRECESVRVTATLVWGWGRCGCGV